MQLLLRKLHWPARHCLPYVRLTWYGLAISQLGVLGMKTTLNLNDEVVRRSKERAAREGITLTRFVEDALVVKLSNPGRKPPFRLSLKTVRGTRPPNVDISDRNALYDVIDRE